MEKSIIPLGIFGTFALAMIATYIYRALARSRKILDHPNNRSSHVHATPRGGGVSIIISWLFSVIVIGTRIGPFDNTISICLTGGLTVAVVGYLDDLFSISALTRFIVQAFTALAFSTAALYNSPLKETVPYYVAAVLTIAIASAILWSVNLFNFMDGLDGMAATEAIFIFTVGGWLLWWEGAHFLAYAAWSLSASTAGFLAFNKPQATIFLGDAGSYLLGFSIAAFSTISYLNFQISPVVWMILYGTFIMDATITLLRRIVLGEAIFSAHRRHAYQRLHHIQKWTHRKVLFAKVLINLALSVIAILAYYYPEFDIALGAMSFMGLFAIYYKIEKLAPMSHGRL